MLYSRCYRERDVGIRDAARKAAGAIEDARATISVSAAISVAALVVACAALIVAIVRD